MIPCFRIMTRATDPKRLLSGRCDVMLGKRRVFRNYFDLLNLRSLDKKVFSAYNKRAKSARGVLRIYR